MIVCDGCCCGRVEKGHNKVPVKQLQYAWQKYELENHVKLTISGCLGPCKMHNVSILKTDESQTWLGKLSQQEHYDAIVKWALQIAENNVANLPNVLVPLQFERTERV